MYINAESNDRTSDPPRLVLNLADKIDWKGSWIKYAAFSSLSINYTKKHIQSHTKQ